jgi:hypothetical protein
MNIKRNQSLFTNDFTKGIRDLSNQIYSAHNELTSTFQEASNLYSESAIIEDTSIKDFMVLKDEIDHIDLFKNKTITIQDSFLNASVMDQSFPVKASLNLDSNNGTINILPIKTTSLNVKAIIIESESNGSSGNYYRNNINSNLNLVINNSSNGIFVNINNARDR